MEPSDADIFQGRLGRVYWSLPSTRFSRIGVAARASPASAAARPARSSRGAQFARLLDQWTRAPRRMERKLLRMLTATAGKRASARARKGETPDRVNSQV